LFWGKFPAFRVTFGFVIRAEPAVIDAYIGWFNVKITIEKSTIAIVPSSCYSGKKPKCCKISFCEKKNAFLGSNPDITGYFIGYQPEIFIFYVRKEILHGVFKGPKGSKSEPIFQNDFKI
jgi:hypothetical protein